MSRAILLEVEPPFHLEATVRLLQRRPTGSIDRWEDQRYLRGFDSEEGLILTSTRDRGSCDEPRLELAFPDRRPSAALAKQLARTLRKILGLDSLPAAFARSAAKHPALRRLAADLRGMRPPRFPTLMEAFGRIVPYQQLSLDSGTATVNRLVERFGPALRWDGASRAGTSGLVAEGEHGKRHAETKTRETKSAERKSVERKIAEVGSTGLAEDDAPGLLFHAFPSAAALASATPEDLRATGLSHSKARTLIDAAAALAAGTLDEAALERLPTPAAYDRLLQLWGVGPWTASLLLLRGLGRLDAFPVGDVGAGRGLALLFGADPATFVAEEYALAFGEQRGMLYFYALGAQLLERGLIQPAPRPKRS